LHAYSIPYKAQPLLVHHTDVQPARDAPGYIVISPRIGDEEAESIKD
ncbi:unnamed protein product, partial [marine sediment metagenome]